MTPESPQPLNNPGMPASPATPPMQPQPQMMTPLPAQQVPASTPAPATANTAPILVPVKKKFPVGLVVGILGAIIAIAITAGIISVTGLLNRDPAIGTYSLYATTRNGVDNVDDVTGLKLMGLSMSVEFRRNGTGKIYATSTRYEGEDAIEFNWKEGKLEIIDKEKDMALKMNTMTNYELADDDKTILLYNIDSNMKIKFKRVTEENK